MKVKKTGLAAAILCLILLLGMVIFGETFLSERKETQTARQEQEKSSQEALPEISVTFFNIKKADCILIELQEKVVMIDTGLNKNGEEICKKLEEKGIEELEYLILTHPDKDHIGGADIILKQIPVKNLLETDLEIDSGEYQEYQAAAQENGVVPLPVKEELNFTLDGAEFSVYPPMKSLYNGENDYSLVIKLNYGNTGFLFSGDAEKIRLQELLTQIPDLQSTLLKVPHHGVLEDNSKLFFQKVKPSYAVITASKKTEYKEAARLLEEQGVKIFMTYEGEVEAVSDGKQILMIQ